MPELQIIGAPQSNYVWVARIACHEKGVPYTLVPVMPHTPEVDAVHPLGKIPALLGRVLCAIDPTDPEGLGLLALMLLHDSRREARVDSAGALVTLEEQDRSVWDRAQIEEGRRLVESALRTGRVGPYQLQAAIAALHAEAASAAATDWAQIAALYGELARIQPSPVVQLNGAVAIGMSEGPHRGLALIDELGDSGELDRYHLFHAARADMLRRLGSFEAAADAYRRALALMANGVERAYLERRLSAL